MRKFLFLILAMLLTAQVWAQRTVTGIVTDEKGSPLADISVQVKGTSTGTVTGTDGKYTISVPANGRTLVFSAVNMGTQELTIGDRTSVDVTLRTSDKSLDEVVVIGYGTARRREVTGNIARINGAALRDQPVQSFEQGLSGRAAGVNINIPNGVVGNPPVIRVRGINSISLSSFPLVVVDGVPVFTGDVGTVAANNALGDINPADIESVEVLKDAAATAIYGSRAAAGVLIITTKKGRQGRARVNYDGWTGWTKAYNLIEVLNAQEFTDIKNEGLVNAGTPPNGVDRGFYTMKDANGNLVDTRWYDHVFRTGFAHNHNISFSGANEKTNYYFSAGYTDQEGFLIKNDLRRMTGRFTLDHKITDRLSAGVTFNYTNSLINGTASGSTPANVAAPNGNAFSTGGAGRLPLVLAPNVGPYKNDGTYNINTVSNIIGQGNNLTQLNFFNPVYTLEKDKFSSRSDRMLGNIYGQVKIIEGLNFKTAFGIDNLSVEGFEFLNPVHGDGVEFAGRARNLSQRLDRWNWQNLLTYDKQIANDHNFNFLLGAEEQHTDHKSWGADRRQVADPDFDEFQGSFVSILPYAFGNFINENHLSSFFSRINYNYKNKYYLSLNGRRDGYSAFAPGKKWGNFWGASAGWTVSQESFYQNSGIADIVSTLKLRASYGKVGNFNGLRDFASLNLFSSGLYGDNTTFYFSQTGNPNLTWESSKKTDIGFSLGLLRDRFTLEFAYYKNDIDGLILDDPQAPSRGIPTSPGVYNAIPVNIGEMYNQGIELTLGGAILRKGDFSWNSSFNITTQRNEVTALAGGNADIQVATSSLERPSIIRVGESIGSFLAVKTEGVNPENGRRIFVLGDGTRVQYNQAASAANRWTRVDNGAVARAANQITDGMIIGPALPTYFGGFDNTFRWKGFDLNVLLYFSGGNYVYNGTKAGLRDYRNWNNTKDVLNRWQKPGDVTNIPRYVFGDNVSNGSALVISDNVEKGDFIKARNLSLGYTLPKSIIDRVKLNSVRMYVAALNAFTITKYTGFDPEIQANGNSNGAPSVDRNSVPMARTINVGLNIGF